MEHFLPCPLLQCQTWIEQEMLTAVPPVETSGGVQREMGTLSRYDTAYPGQLARNQGSSVEWFLQYPPHLHHCQINPLKLKTKKTPIVISIILSRCAVKSTTGRWSILECNTSCRRGLCHPHPHWSPARPLSPLFCLLSVPPRSVCNGCFSSQEH